MKTFLQAQSRDSDNLVVPSLLNLKRHEQHEMQVFFHRAGTPALGSELNLANGFKCLFVSTLSLEFQREGGIRTTHWESEQEAVGEGRVGCKPWEHSLPRMSTPTNSFSLPEPCRDTWPGFRTRRPIPVDGKAFGGFVSPTRGPETHNLARRPFSACPYFISPPTSLSQASLSPP